MSEVTKSKQEPSVITWAIKVASSAGLAAILCCVAPAILFMFGLMGGVYAISFADFFYNDDGSAAAGAWVLRVAAVAIGAFGVYQFRKQQNQCSIDPKRKRNNLILVSIITVVLAAGIYLSLEKWSSWYFNEHIVPAQQEELFGPEQQSENN
jgi:hypothetical protein